MVLLKKLEELALNIFTCKGVDVSAWRKNSNSDKLEGDLKLELARKI